MGRPCSGGRKGRATFHFMVSGAPGTGRTHHVDKSVRTLEKRDVIPTYPCHMDTRTAFAFDNTYARTLPQLAVPFRPATPRAPRLLFLNRAFAGELGVHLEGFDEQALAEVFSGSRVPEGAEPIAQAYAGHQFGH